jgi:ATP-binding cassette subfamily B protein
MLRPHRSKLIPAFFLAVFQTLLGISTALFLQVLIDQALLMGSIKALYLLGGIMVFIVIVQLCSTYLKSQIMLKTGLEMDRKLMSNYLQKVMTLPQIFFDRMQKGEIISRFGDAVKIRAFISDIAMNLFINTLILIFAFGVMISTEWRLGLGMLAVIPLYALLLFFVNRKNRRLQRKLMEDAAKLESSLIENMNGIRTIKHFATEEITFRKMDGLLEMLLTSARASGKLGILSQVSTSFVNKLLTVLILIAGGSMVIYGQLSLGELMAFYALIAYFSQPVSELIHANQSYQDAMIATDRLFEIQDLENEVKETSTELPACILPIQMDKVSFSYGAGDEILRNISLQLEAGKIYAVAGDSGSGKSTLAKLIEGIYPVDEGQIRINKLDLRNIAPKELRKRIGTVSQDIELFTGSLAENIAFGSDEPNEERILEVCNLMGMQSFLSGLPFGLQTPIGEYGIKLSGGQSQLIALARAIYTDPEFIILDEATSAVDANTEELVLEALKRLRDQGKTILLITHRIKNCLIADHIFIMRQGKIIEEGSHRELFRPGSFYFGLLRKQSPFVDEFFKMSA